MRKLPARYAAVVFPFVLSVLMSCIVSGISTVRASGIGPAFVQTWMSAWGWSWLVAFPTVMLVLPLVRKVVATVVELPRH